MVIGRAAPACWLDAERVLGYGNGAMRSCLVRLFALLAGSLSCSSPAVAATEPATRITVGQWDRFETLVRNSRPYADPYRQVSLDVTFARPDGTRVTFWGFHDGEGTWRIRYMPDQIGTWTFSARFSDDSPGAEGTFACVKSDHAGPLEVHAANPMWFGHRGGDAALVRGLHVGDRFFARNWDPARRTAFLDWAGRQGYNLLSIGSHYLNRNTAGRGAGWDTPRLWPLDAAEYRRMEAILDDLAARRIAVFPFAGFFGRDSNFPSEPEEQLRYLKYTYARLGTYGNTLLNVAGPEPLLKGRPYSTKPDLVRLGTEIQRLNVFTKPLTVHNRTGDDEYRDEPWTTYGTLQGPKTIDRVRLSRGLLASHHAGKPLLAQETLWSGNVNHIRANKRDYTDEELRKNAFVIHFSAAVLVFADNDGDSSSGFSGTMELSQCRQSRHDVIKKVWDRCGTLPFGRLKPRQDLVNGPHAFCLADPGRYYAVYLDRGLPVSVNLAPYVAGGAVYAVKWIDAQGDGRRIDGGTTRDGQNLTPPVGGDDWVLLVSSGF